MKMKLRVFSVLALCLAMLFSLSVSVSAEQENGFNYYIENGEAIVCGYEGGSTSITVPKELGGYPVTRLDYSCFDGYSHLTSVKLPNTLCVISANAFSGCTGLTSLDIPVGVTKISTYAFSGCTSLKSISLPDSLVELGSGAFNTCVSLKEITIPASVAEIPGNAFNYCSSLRDVTIMGRDTVVYDDLFAMMMDGRRSTFTIWEESCADVYFKENFVYHPDVAIRYLMVDTAPEQMTAIQVVTTDKVASEEKVLQSVPSGKAKEPTLVLAGGATVKAANENGEPVEIEEASVVYEIYKDTEDTVVYNLHIVSESGDVVSATFNPPQALVLPYPSGITYEMAQTMRFEVAHETSKGTEYYSTMSGDLSCTPAGLLLYTSSFSPFTITWEENPDPSGLPQTGDKSLPLGMLMAFAMLGCASALAFKRRHA